jgi:hypothetical protein
VRLGKPPEPEIDRFKCLSYDGFTLYLSKSLLINAPFSIVVRRFLWWKGLAVEGWKLL